MPLMICDLRQSMNCFVLMTCYQRQDGGEYDDEDVSTERIARLSPLVRDLCLEIFQMRHLDDLVDYLASKGLDV